MKRLFLALRAEVNDYDKIQADFSHLLEGRWVARENLHITVCFFGDEYSVEELLDGLPSLIEEIEPIDLISLDHFEHNNILFAKAESEKLEMLQASISNSFSLPNSKEFIPHVTLMRIKNICNKELFKGRLENYKNKTLGKVSNRFELMQSYVQHPGGARYKCLKRFEK